MDQMKSVIQIPDALFMYQFLGSLQTVHLKPLLYRFWIRCGTSRLDPQMLKMVSRRFQARKALRRAKGARSCRAEVWRGPARAPGGIALGAASYLHHVGAVEDEEKIEHGGKDRDLIVADGPLEGRGALKLKLPPRQKKKRENESVDLQHLGADVRTHLDLFQTIQLKRITYELRNSYWGTATLPGPISAGRNDGVPFGWIAWSSTGINRAYVLHVWLK